MFPNATPAGHRPSPLVSVLRAIGGRFLLRSSGISAPVQTTLPTPKPVGAGPITQSLPATDRAKRWAMVKHLDENSAARREVQAQNEAELLQVLGAMRRSRRSFDWMG